jgi:murein DD-endopeptidase MepM/ murein hydrolase activator NlpD
MRNAIFHYNKETCQYELASISIRSIAVYCLGVIFTSAAFFASFVILYDRFTETPTEAALRKENIALDKHQILLTGQVAEVERALAKLKSIDHELYQKLFDEAAITETQQAADNKSILLADEMIFADMLGKVDKQSHDVYKRAATANRQFTTMHIAKEDVLILKAVPTLQPIANPNPDLLVSGYGIRINPFHKGKYKHPGIDFAAVRGTEVFATAPGRVIDINKSELQAGYGNSIDIDHGHGFVTRYAHLEDIRIRTGQQVTKGMVIGTVGNSGGSIAPHLHYEVIHRGENVDPMIYMIGELNSDHYNKLISLSKRQNQSLD